MIGADIVKISRIKEAIKSEHFVSRVFTKSECAYADGKQNAAQTYAGIFAAKEAVSKLGGKGIRGFGLTDIEITYTELGAPKVSLYGKAKEVFAGEVYVSISHEDKYAFCVATTVKENFAPVLPGKEITDSDLQLQARKRFTHKGDYGKVYVIGGSSFMVGAPLICAEAAVKAGAGLTTLCVSRSLLNAYQARVKEVMLKDISDDGKFMQFDRAALDEIIAKADVIVIGMGMGANPHLIKILDYVFQNFLGTLVCDADGINACSKNPELLIKQRRCNLILTPHVGEFERLKDALGLGAVEEVALKINAVVACKSAHTLVSDGITTYKVTSGCAAMAKGGSGDALAGIISAYACRTTPLQATTLACHYFGKCGQKAALLKGENAVVATDIINCL